MTTAPKVTPIRRRLLVDEVTDDLRERILSGRLAPGDALVEAELCDRYGVSPTPVRQALRVLAAEGLVTIRPGSGSEVASMTETEITELFEVVPELEKLAVELAVDRMSDNDYAQLDKRHQKMVKHYRAGNRRAFFEADYGIHNFLVKKSGNDLLVATHANLMSRARRGRYQALKSQARWDESMAQHEAIHAAILARDADRAGRLMRAHVRDTGQVLLRELRARTG
jgi:DNA-binding GntR family transcriptional regulator